MGCSPISVFLTIVLSTALAVGLFASSVDAQQQNVLVSKKASAPPPVGTLTREARRFTARDVPVDTIVCIGEPAREIVRLASGGRIDLIVMGSHKVRGGRRATGWGTMSYKVGVFCRCPVLLVK